MNWGLSFLQRLAGSTPWKPEWQQRLNESLKEAQRGLSVNMVVVVARESDFYAELLYLLSVLGLGIGVMLAWALPRFSSEPLLSDPLLLPLGGFAAGNLLFAFRARFLHKFAPRAVRERVAARAKAQFFNHEQHLKGHLILLYLSEMEEEALLLSSAELTPKISEVPELPRLLSRLVSGYSRSKPLEKLEPALRDLGETLRVRLGEVASNTSLQGTGAVFVAASDRGSQIQVPLLKGSKDIN
jgi:uncharacterized membrane protein